MSIFAGALSDKWNKKITMLVSDSIAALCTVAVLLLFYADRLEIWHLYCLNAVNGLMNTVQQPGGGCGDQPADPAEALPKGQRYAILFQFTG